MLLIFKIEKSRNPFEFRLFHGIQFLFLFFRVGGFELRNDFVRNVRRDGLITGKFHFKCAASLGHGTEFRGVFGKLGEGDFRIKHLNAVFRIHADDAAALLIQMSRNVAHELRRRIDFDRHDGFSEHGIRFAHRFTERLARGNFECHFR
ncbi:MAG TPA: hypothetical protein DDZ11_12805 [Lentisphaeria bacterium]|nr:hypothetical protein [Lentisphaeria bacterium]